MPVQSPANEIINILQDIVSKTNNSFELQNIKLIVPDTIINEDGIKITRSYNNIQISYNDFIKTKMQDILTYLTLMLSETTEDYRKINNYSVRMYRKYDLMELQIRKANQLNVK